MATYPAARQKIFIWALESPSSACRTASSGRPMPLGLAIKSGIADKLVFQKILARLGGRVQFVLSGGAPLPPSWRRSSSARAWRSWRATA